MVSLATERLSPPPIFSLPLIRQEAGGISILAKVLVRAGSMNYRSVAGR